MVSRVSRLVKNTRLLKVRLECYYRLDEEWYDGIPPKIKELIDWYKKNKSWQKK